MISKPKRFVELSREEKLELCAAVIDGKEIECLSEDGWFNWVLTPRNLCSVILWGDGIYRIKPKQLVIPWDLIKPELKFAAMDINRNVFGFSHEPKKVHRGWIPVNSSICTDFGRVLTIDTAGVDWETSLIRRPE